MRSFTRRTLLLLWSIAGLPLALAGGAESTSRPALKEVIVVFKTHFDIGYTNLAQRVVESYRTDTMDRALATFDASRAEPAGQRFVWTIPGWPLTQILGPEQSASRREHVVDMIQSGQLVWHALPASLHTESLELEDVVRGLVFSSRLSRQLGQPLPREAKMTDVPSHAWGLPTILAHAGVEFLHLGCNSASAVPDVPMLFWWEGPDGSRVLTMQSPDYGSKLLPPKDWPYSTWLALMHRGDNQGAPSVKEVRALLDQAARELPGVRVRVGRMSDFSDAIGREHPQIPVVRADMPDTWIHGIMASPADTSLARRVRPELAALESLNTLLRGWGVKVEDASKTVAAAYEQSLLYGEHTWGMAVRLFGQRVYGEVWKAERAKGTYAKLEVSWEEHSNYIRQADRLVTPALQTHLDLLSANVQAEGRRVVVFNPLAWKRDDLVSVSFKTDSPDGLKDLASGESVPAVRIGQQVTFLARDLPPLGYRTYVSGPVVAGDKELIADSAGSTLENSRLRLRIDQDRGGIVSLVDKTTGRELVDTSAELALGQYIYERFDADDVKRFVNAYNRPERHNDSAFGKLNLPPATATPHSTASPHGYELELHQDGLVSVARLSVPASDAVPHAVSITVRLYRDQPYVDIEWSVTAKEPTPWPEAGWLAFPLKASSPQFRLGRLGCIVDPAKDLCRATNHHVFCLNTGVSVTGEDGQGAVVCPLDSPLVSLDHPGLWEYSRDFVPRRARVYVNLFNNQWSTNFRQWIGGSWHSSVRVWPPGQEQAGHDLVENCWEARCPAQASVFDGPAGRLPPTQAGIELSRPGVRVTAFGPNPDGTGVLLRLWEQSGGSGACRVQLPTGFRPTTIQPCDLRGQPSGDAIVVHEGRFEVAMTPFAPVSLLLSP